MSETWLVILLVEKQKSHSLAEGECHRYHEQKFLGTWVHLTVQAGQIVAQQQQKLKADRFPHPRPLWPFLKPFQLNTLCKGRGRGHYPALGALLRTSAARLTIQRIHDSGKEAVMFQVWMVQLSLHRQTSCSWPGFVPECPWGSTAHTGGEEWSLLNRWDGCGY